MFRILYPDARFADDGVIERGLLANRRDIELTIFHEQPHGVADIPDTAFATCDALVVYHKLKIDDALLDRVPKCRLIVRAGVGLNNIDLAACAAREIPVCNVPDYGTNEVADHTVALMLTLMRGTLAYDTRLRANLQDGWRFDGIGTVRRLSGAVLGIAGLGRIGAAVAERGAAFGMKVLHLGGKQDARFERARSLDDLLERSDVLSLHLPLKAETRNIIGAATIAKMKRGMILINTARGGLIDPAALCEGLRSGRVAGVGLDVLPTEPPDLADPLIAAWSAGEDWIRDKVVLTPHAAFFSEAAFHELRESSIHTVLAFRRDGELRNCVNGQR